MKYVRYLWLYHAVYLRNSEITDDRLLLNEIDLTGTKVTPAGIKDLRHKLPNMQYIIK